MTDESPRRTRPGTRTTASATTPLQRDHRLRYLVAGLAAAFALAFLTPLGSTAPADAPGSLRPGRASALPPDRAVCSGGGSFCGAVLRIESSAGTIPSVAAGAHYGRAWGIPPTPNDSVGTGWCVDDTHTGFPVGPIVEQPLADGWTTLHRRVAATLITLYGGDRVLPYQPLDIDERGELVGAVPAGATPTRIRHIALWLALRSVLADPAGTPRIDLATATTFSDRAGTRPSTLGNAAIPIARHMVEIARRMTVSDAQPVVDIQIDDERLPPRTDDHVLVPVRVTDRTGQPIPHVPVWPADATNVTITPQVPDDPASLRVHRNAERAGWPSFDTRTHRSTATVTDAHGVATFRLRLKTASTWSVSFAAETAATRLQLFGDGIRAQNNVTVRAGDATITSSVVNGDASPLQLQIVKTSTDDDFSVAGATFTVVDADDVEIGRATTGGDGVIDLVFDAHRRTPFRLREIDAPPGLAAIVQAIVVGDAQPLSTDPDAPTTVVVENEPELHQVTLAKRVLGAPDQPADLSGFTFTITRLTDRNDVTTVVTAADGRTPTIQLVAGDYDVAEIARPDWWPGDHSLPAPTTLSVPRETHDPIVFTVDNTFPPPPTTTTTTVPPTTTTTVTPSTTTVPPTTTTTVTPSTTTTLPPTTTTVTPSTTTVPPTTTIPPPTTTVPATSPIPPPPLPTTTTTTTTAPPSPTTTPPSTAPPTTAPPTTAPPAPDAPTQPTLPQTGMDAWRVWYRIGSFVTLAGAVLFCASTIGLASRRDPARTPGSIATRPHDPDNEER